MRWDKTVIVVMNEVRVSSPYLSESVTGGTPAANERVRKVVRYPLILKYFMRYKFDERNSLLYLEFYLFIYHFFFSLS